MFGVVCNNVIRLSLVTSDASSYVVATSPFYVKKCIFYDDSNKDLIDWVCVADRLCRFTMYPRESRNFDICLFITRDAGISHWIPALNSIKNCRSDFFANGDKQLTLIYGVC